MKDTRAGVTGDTNQTTVCKQQSWIEICNGVIKHYLRKISYNCLGKDEITNFRKNVCTSL